MTRRHDMTWHDDDDDELCYGYMFACMYVHSHGDLKKKNTPEKKKKKSQTDSQELVPYVTRGGGPSGEKKRKCQVLIRWCFGAVFVNLFKVVHFKCKCRKTANIMSFWSCGKAASVAVDND